MSKKTWNACNTCRICISNEFWNGWWIEVNIRRYQQARKVSAFFRRHFSRRSFGDKRATEQQICIFTSLRLCGKRFPCVCACFLGIFTSSLSDVYYFTPKRLFYGVTVTPMMPQRLAKPLNDSVTFLSHSSLPWNVCVVKVWWNKLPISLRVFSL